MLYLTEQEFITIMTHIKDNYGVNLSKKKTLIEGRLSNHVLSSGFDNYTDYFDMVLRDKTGNEMSILINKLTTNHTYFGREKDHFDFYRDSVLPWLDKSLKTKDLRIWSAGCSSGQEPYTLSMITMNYLGANVSAWDSTILASDISNKVLSSAKEGVYTEEQIGELPEDWQRRFFISKGEGLYTVTDALRNNVVYRNFNLLSPFQFKQPFQAIFCRNVMIYFDGPLKEQVVNKFYNALIPGGFLFVGLSESLSGLNHRFKSVKPSIYRKVD